MTKDIEILGVEIDNVSEKEAVNKVELFLKDSKKHYIVTPNPEIIVLAQKEQKFKTILNNADLSIPDGVGILWASKILGGDDREVIRQRVTGTDLLISLCQLAAKRGFRTAFLGGRGHIAEQAAECLKEKSPNLKVVFALGSDPNNAIKDIKNTISHSPLAIRKKVVDLLFVAYGAPKQEYWIERNLPNIPVKVAMVVGGAFDYIAGEVGRAPKWMQELGLEWLYRLLRQPWRIKRQLALVRFIFLVLKEKFTRSRMF